MRRLRGLAVVPLLLGVFLGSTSLAAEADANKPNDAASSAQPDGADNSAEEKQPAAGDTKPKDAQKKDKSSAGDDATQPSGQGTQAAGTPVDDAGTSASAGATPPPTTSATSPTSRAGVRQDDNPLVAPVGPASPSSPGATKAASVPPAPPAKTSQDAGLWTRYTTWYDGWLERILAKPLWGNSAQLPQGVLKMRYNYSHARAAAFFDRNGKELPLLPHISIGQGASAFELDPHVEGVGYSHEFQISYGITDPLDVFVEIPFTVVKSSLELRDGKTGGPLDDLTAASLQSSLVANGRPMPGSTFDGTFGGAMGDMRTGVSWNYYRSKHFSTSMTPSIWLPTGHPADPDNDLTMMLGSEIDRGMGAWAAGLVQDIDVHPFDWLTWTVETGIRYRFGYHRKSPHWLPITDCKRLKDPAARQANQCPDSSAYDEAYDLQQSQVFPNMAGLDDTYYVYPAWSTTISSVLSVDVFHIPIQLSWEFNHNEAVFTEASGAGNSGPAFDALVQSLGLLSRQDSHVVAIGASIPLLPLYIPMFIKPAYRRMVSGRNIMKLADQYSVAFELFLPVGEAF